MKSTQILSVLVVMIFHDTESVRLHKLFQLIDGYKSEHDLQGFLHVGLDYAVFIKAPKTHDKLITYELYEATNVPVNETFMPQMLAVSKIPIDYLKDQLSTFRGELYKAKYVDDNVVPGTQVKTVREWQIAKSLSMNKSPQMLQIPVLRQAV